MRKALVCRRIAPRWLGCLLALLGAALPAAHALAQDAVAPAPPRQQAAPRSDPETLPPDDPPGVVGDAKDDQAPPPDAEEPRPVELFLANLAAYDSALGPGTGHVDELHWPETQQLGVHLELLLRAHDAEEFTEPRKLSLFLAINGPDKPDGTDGPVLFKNVADHWVEPGELVYDYPEALDLSGVFGSQQLTLHLEANMKGLPTLIYEETVDWVGPAQPLAQVASLDLRDERGRQRDIFFAGGDFTLDAQLTAYANPLQPLRAVVRTELDCAECPPGTTRLEAVPAVEEYRDLPGPMGQWTLSVRGRLPQQLPETAKQFTPFRVTVLLLSGETVVAEASRFGVIRLPGGESAGRSAIELDHSADWQLGLD